MTNIFDSLKDTRLVGIEFIHDYFQLRFENGNILNIFNRSTLNAKSNYEIAKFVKCKVRNTTADDQMIKINFISGDSIIIGLLDEDYKGPEAVEYIGAEGERIVI